MAAATSMTTSITGEKKPGSHVDIENGITVVTNDFELSKFPVMDKVDKFGAHAKTDPREIALVKKLDWYIMVSVRSFLNADGH
jgi:hypothetical protein